jgi:aryl-alcohol dehydrogenase-like predicted oxidoreductase
VQAIQELAQKKECTPGQLALAWVHAQWEGCIAIPGTTRVEALSENLESGRVQLDEQELGEIRKILDSFRPTGDRYQEWMMALEDK